LRARFGALSELDVVFRRLNLGARRCDLGDQGLYLAEELVAADRWLGGSDPEALGILVLALMIAQRQGSTRLPLDPSPRGALRALVDSIVAVSGLAQDATRIVRRIAALTAAPSFGSVLGAGDTRAPLVVDDGCLYSERSRWLEVRVAARLAARLRAPATRDVTPARAELATVGLSEEQLRAAMLALASPLAVITGGPGTGKTRVAAAIVRGFARLGVRDVALAAPTGKAANRLAELVGTIATTLHRLLGYGERGFAHHSRSPLPIGALIVDEASMIDLELMDALLDALPDAIPLVLIGDAHQLPAVDAGRILADLVDRAAPPFGGAAGAAQLPTGERVMRLEHSYRMDVSDPGGRAVFHAAQAVQSGELPKVSPRTPGTLAFSGVEWVDAARTPDAARAVAAAVWHHFDGPHAQDLANQVVFQFEDGAVAPPQAAELERLWRLAGRARILAVTRGLPTGARALNAYLHELALARMTVTSRPELVPGEPVMITANDYQRGLFNGDQGLVVRADEGLGNHHYRAVFRVGGRLVPFAIEALRDRLELAWALTVHKSQGSELDAVALVLPEDDLPLLTRELLYTGITRARTSVVLCGSRAALVSGSKRMALRHSGLAARIARCG
jgi:exodeoxyribonuclease V alpha subunit